MLPELIGVIIIAIMFCIAVLVTGRGRKGETLPSYESLPSYEILARGMEEAAEALIFGAKEDAAKGIVSSTSHSLSEAERLFNRARQIRKEAMEKMANGEFL